MQSNIQIHCKYHPNELITRIKPSFNAFRTFYCVECILEDNDSQLSQDIIKIEQFFNDLKKEQQSTTTKPFPKGNQPPTDILEFLRKRNQLSEELNLHITNEKRKVKQYFSNIKEKVISFLNQQETNLLFDLDSQVNNFSLNFELFQSQLEKYFDFDLNQNGSKPSYEEMIVSCSAYDELELTSKRILYELHDKKVMGSFHLSQEEVINSLNQIKSFILDSLNDLKQIDLSSLNEQNDKILDSLQRVMSEFTIGKDLKGFDSVMAFGSTLNQKEFLITRLKLHHIECWDEQYLAQYEPNQQMYDLLYFYFFKFQDSLLIIETKEDEKIVSYIKDNEIIIFKPFGKVYKEEINPAFTDYHYTIGQHLQIECDNNLQHYHLLDENDWKKFQIKRISIIKYSDEQIQRKYVTNY